MKIVRNIAPDMRQALRSVREQLGEDAVILSSRRVPEGVEVTAAVDFDAASLQDAMNTPADSLAHGASGLALGSSRLAPAPLPPSSAPVSTPRPLTPPSRQTTVTVAQPVHQVVP